MVKTKPDVSTGILVSTLRFVESVVVDDGQSNTVLGQRRIEIYEGYLEHGRIGEYVDYWNLEGAKRLREFLDGWIGKLERDGECDEDIKKEAAEDEG